MDNTQDQDTPAIWRSLPVRLASAWIIGLIAGAQLPWLWGWIVVAAVLILYPVAATCLIPKRACIKRNEWLLLAAAACLAAGWGIVHRDYVSAQSVTRFISTDGAIARVRGTVIRSPRDLIPGQGPMGAFNFRNPGTLLELRVETVDAGEGFKPTDGAILVRLKENDHRLALGQRIEATGRLNAINPTQNPGEFDYREYLQRQGITGQLTLARQGNWHELDPPPRFTLTGIRRSVSDGAAASLRRGLPHDPERVGLLEALLLGRRSNDVADLSDAFRQVGLAHILSISGAHLGILLLLVWSLCRLVIGNPRVVTVIVLMVLAMFLLAVPWRTPIIRAAIMAGVFCIGYGMGRRLAGLDTLAIAVLIVLIWKPGDLFTAGFQLSFGVVAALLIFSPRVSLRLWPEPQVQVIHTSPGQVAWRWFIDFLAVSLVAYLTAAPLVMYHFQLVNPFAVILSMLALAPLTMLLGLGYLKILIGLALPTASGVLVVPVMWASDTLATLIERAALLPAAGIDLQRQPTVLWTLGASAAVMALLSGMFNKRPAALTLSLIVLVGWLWIGQQPPTTKHERAAELTVTMFAVGDGSCYLVQADGKTLMFDCGSQAFLRLGERSIVPAMRELGVDRIDILMLSHADLDHFAGVLDVVDRIPVDRVVVSPDILREAENHPLDAAGYLVDQLANRGLMPTAAEQGWREAWGRAQLEVLWPASDFASESNNENSLVLSVRAANRRVLLNGDIQDHAITQLLATQSDLRVDVSDLAHHGAFDDRSVQWIDAISPSVVLQSSSRRRADPDHWAHVLEQRGIHRLATYEMGMVRVVIGNDGTITWTSHRGPSGQMDHE